MLVESYAYKHSTRHEIIRFISKQEAEIRFLRGKKSLIRLSEIVKVLSIHQV